MRTKDRPDDKQRGTSRKQQTQVQTYTAKLKTRKAFQKIRDTEGYVDAYGWWVDVCPGETLQLRDATADDLARCYLRENASRNPADWLCETFERGALVARSAIDKLTPNPMSSPMPSSLSTASNPVLSA